MHTKQILIAAAALSGLVSSTGVSGQFIDAGTFTGNQTLGNPGTAGQSGFTGSAGLTGGGGRKGKGGMGGVGGYNSGHFSCLGLTYGDFAHNGWGGLKGGYGGVGGSGGRGGKGGSGGPGGAAKWTLAATSSFTNKGMIQLGGEPGRQGPNGGEGETGERGPSGNTGNNGGDGGWGGHTASLGIGTGGLQGEGTAPGYGGATAIAGFNGAVGGSGLTPDGGGGGGGGGGGCLFGTMGIGGTGGEGFGGTGEPGDQGDPGSDTGGIGESAPGAPITRVTSGEFTNEGTIIIGSEGGDGGSGGKGGPGGLGGSGGAGGDGGGGGGGGGGMYQEVRYADFPGVYPGKGGDGGPSGNGGRGGQPGLGGVGGNLGPGGRGQLVIDDEALAVNTPGATIEILPRGVISLVGTLVNNGNIQLIGSKQIEGDGILTGNGSIVGQFFNGGTFAPGDAIGAPTISGDYVESGTLRIDINGLAGGSEYDFVNVSEPGGNVLLEDSILEIQFLPGFDLGTLKTGDEFDIIRYTGNLNGSFADIIQPLPGLFEVDYTNDGSLTLRYSGGVIFKDGFED